MSQDRPRVTGLLALLAVLVLAPVAGAAAPTDSAPAGAKSAKERAYGKHCGSARKAPGRSGDRAKCLDAMSRLATGRSSSPRRACRALSRKKVNGSRTSAFALCVKAGAKLMKSKGRRGGASATTGDDPDLGGEGDSDDGDHGAGGDDAADGDDGAAMGQPSDDWAPAAEAADDQDPDPALDGDGSNHGGGPRA